jgi:hypothetical protein
MIGSNIPKAVKARLDEQHSDLCRMWGLFGAGCDCGASKAATRRIVSEVSGRFRREIDALFPTQNKGR